VTNNLDRRDRKEPLFLRAARAAQERRLLTHVLLIGFGLLMLYPLLWMVSSAVKPEELIFREPGLIPSGVTLDNFSDGWNALRHPFGHYFVNSAIITMGAVIGNLLACSLAAYAFARLEFPFKKTLFAIMLGSIMLPLHVVLVPQYILFSNLGWINTFWPLIIPKFLATDAFFIFLMVQFIRTLPRELDEAAVIDGAGHWRIFSRIIIPLSMPALATTAIFTFIWTWNDFLSQMIFLTNPDKFTVPVALRTFLDSSGESSWGPMFAISVLSLAPIFGFFLAGQKYLVRGIATTGLK
jgi:multiple sugar transport system permease protein